MLRVPSAVEKTCETRSAELQRWLSDAAAAGTALAGPFFPPQPLKIDQWRATWEPFFKMKAEDEARAAALSGSNNTLAASPDSLEPAAFSSAPSLITSEPLSAGSQPDLPTPETSSGLESPSSSVGIKAQVPDKDGQVFAQVLKRPADAHDGSSSSDAPLSPSRSLVHSSNFLEPGSAPPSPQPPAFETHATNEYDDMSLEEYLALPQEINEEDEASENPDVLATLGAFASSSSETLEAFYAILAAEAGSNNSI